jgi:2Fe-2S ferredoxin
MLPRVRVEPLGAEIEVRSGETVMDAAVRVGLKWPTLCHGEATCGVCAMEVVDGGQSLSQVRPEEQERLETLPMRRFCAGELRLACQVEAAGDAVVHKRGVRPHDEATELPHSGRTGR